MMPFYQQNDRINDNRHYVRVDLAECVMVTALLFHSTTHSSCRFFSHRIFHFSLFIYARYNRMIFFYIAFHPCVGHSILW